ncbi:MAG: bifunctional 2-polyprenyl-6-hydroxyphenol methylase/3-demethylubiquinol 3-O-methyltransferase UbiG [Gammaproteobacteria bacterium]
MTRTAFDDSNADTGEVEKFRRLSDRWWDQSGPLATLHAINPLRAEYIAGRARIEGARVLDVGCGGGILSESLARLGGVVTGVDLAAENIEVARAHAEEQGLQIDYQVGSVEAMLAAAGGPFDLVTCLELLEHVPEPEITVAACARLVRPGGTVFFSTINRNLKSFALAIVGAEYVLRMLPRGTHEFVKFIKPSELARAVRSAGLDVDNLTGLHFNPLTKDYFLSDNVDVNYFLCARRPEDA